LIASDTLANNLGMFIDPHIGSGAEHAADNFAEHGK